MGNPVGQATNKLGELFVDIGVGGLGQTLKALNSVSATFLLTKNAATQAVKPFIDMGVQAANSAVGIGKMSSALGTSLEKAQKLSYYLKQNKLEGLEGDIARVQQIFAKYQNRTGGIPLGFEDMLRRFGNLHFDKYADGSFESVMQMFKDLREASKKSTLSPQQQIALLEEGGLSSLWKYAFEKEDFDIDGWIGVTEEEIQREIKIAESMQQLRNSIDQLKQKVVATLIDSKFIDKLTVVLDEILKHKDTPHKIKKTAQVAGAAGAGYLVGGPAGAAAVASSIWAANNIKHDNKSIGSNSKIMQVGGGQIDFSINPFSFQTTQQQGGKAAIDINKNTPPKAVIEHNININAPDNTEVSDDSKLLGDIPDLEYTKQTTQNRASY